MFEITDAGNVHYCNQMQYMSTSHIFAYQLEYVYDLALLSNTKYVDIIRCPIQTFSSSKIDSKEVSNIDGLCKIPNSLIYNPEPPFSDILCNRPSPIQW